jgi:hypothetical protein
MPYTVIEVPTPGVLRGQVKALGLYATEDEAEKARRRRHRDNMLKDAWSPPRTFVAEIGEAV